MEKNGNRALYFICKYCRQRFLDMPSLNTHKRDNHLHEILNRSKRIDRPAEEVPADTIEFSGTAAPCKEETTLHINET